MPRARFTPLLVLALALMVLVSAGSAWAHGEHEQEVTAASPSVATIEVAPTHPGAASAAPSPWWAALAGVLLAAGARRRPRRALAVGLVLVLAVFAVESAIHSVHHGLDPHKQRACAIASSGAHLTATPVEFSVEPVVLLRRSDRSLDHELAAPLTRPLRPDQGRAPPTATV